MKRKREKKVELRTVGDPPPKRRLAPVPIIVELSGDGWVQVYGPEHVRPIVINRLDNEVPPAIAADMATLADLYHELELPRSHRPWYWPVHVLATGIIRRRTPESDRRRHANMEVIHEARAIHDELVARQKEKAMA
jgi:hypothetical protein